VTESVFAQPGAGARFDWGVAGAAELSRACAVLVVVDVLSFSTAVDIAVGRGIRVHPFPWDGQAAEYADRIGAAVAVGRSETTADRPWSLSPAALRAAPVVPDLVLPSPNGSAICAAAASTGVPVVAGCLRNARAVAGWLHAQGYGTPDAAVGIVAAGEIWPVRYAPTEGPGALKAQPDGALRPCVEDLLGAAAVIDGLTLADVPLSVESAVALAALAAVPDPPAAVWGCVSGRELAERGYADDVALAVQVDASRTVPVLWAGTGFFQAPGPSAGAYQTGFTPA
jgi:2-phosphosulfolactate phosphatase